MSLVWDGLYCALWTPTDQAGSLLTGAVKEHLAFLRLHGVDGILALGSTGEFLHLEPAVRKEVLREVVENGRPMRVIMNVSDLRPSVVHELSQFSKEVGADAISVLPPYFYPVAQEDLTEFFVRAGEAANLPVFLYNFPERTGNRIELETIAAVANRVPVAGVKQSGADFGYHADLVELGRKKDFVVLTGADTQLGEAVSMGVSGCVSGLSNAVPEVVREALLGARNEKGSAGLKRMKELARRIGVVNFPLDVSAAMQARGREVGAHKSILSATTQGKYARLVKELQELFREWKLA